MGRDEAFYFNTLDGRGPCFACEGCFSPLPFDVKYHASPCSACPCFAMLCHALLVLCPCFAMLCRALLMLCPCFAHALSAWLPSASSSGISEKSHCQIKGRPLPVNSGHKSCVMLQETHARVHTAGHKQQLQWFRSYIVAVLSTPQHQDLPPTYLLQVFDLRNKLIAISIPLSEVCPAWSLSCLFITLCTLCMTRCMTQA